MNVKDQLLTALNGSQQFHTKLASFDGTNTPAPDSVNDGHLALAQQLAGLATVCEKTAEYVAQGYPARLTLADLCLQAGVDQATTEKLASVTDVLGEYLLEQSVVSTYQQKVAEYKQTKQASVQGNPVQNRIANMNAKLPQPNPRTAR